MENEYVEYRDASYWIRGTRVSLDSVVRAFLEGLAPETICVECLPTLTLGQVYGAIAYYLAHRDSIDAYLQQADSEFDALRNDTRRADPEFASRWTEANQADTFRPNDECRKSNDEGSPNPQVRVICAAPARY